jgi:hypothetical protein
MRAERLVHEYFFQKCSLCVILLISKWSIERWKKWNNWNLPDIFLTAIKIIRHTGSRLGITKIKLDNSAFFRGRKVEGRIKKSWLSHIIVGKTGRLNLVYYWEEGEAQSVTVFGKVTAYFTYYINYLNVHLHAIYWFLSVGQKNPSELLMNHLIYSMLNFGFKFANLFKNFPVLCEYAQFHSVYFQYIICVQCRFVSRFA